MITFIWRLLLSIPTTLLQGWVLSYLWAWFIVPKFPGAPRLSVVEAVGVLTAVGTFRVASDFQDVQEKAWEKIKKDEGYKDDGMESHVYHFVFRVLFAAMLLLLGLGMAYGWKQFLP